MAHRKPPERFQAGATGKELKNYSVLPLSERYMFRIRKREYTGNCTLSKEVLRKFLINLLFEKLAVLTDAG
tara:strand:+ start:1432 stop:1644 length:213 start_codon:yes stop_codon:yes gene_type:complete